MNATQCATPSFSRALAGPRSIRGFRRKLSAVSRRLAGPLLLALAATLPATPTAAAAPPEAQARVADKQSSLALDGGSLTPSDVIAVARRGQAVAPTDASWQRVTRSHDLLLAYGRLGQPVYGLNRGVGQNKDQTIFSGDTLSDEARAASAAFNHRMLLSHTVAYGEPAKTETVRAAMLIRLNTALFGGTGMSPPLVRQYVDFLNKGLTPVVLGQGSVGQADITILPQIGLAMMGEGMIELDGKAMPATDAMRRVGLAPVKPYAKDSLSLLSSNAYGAALAILAADEAGRMLDRADEVAALSLEGLNGNIAPLLAITQAQRPYPAQQQVAQRILSLLDGSALWQADEQRSLQDPLSFRTVSQVHGAAREALRQLDVQLRVQINSSDDNPTVILDAAPPPGVSAQEARYYVTQGPQRGAVVPSAGFDPTAWVVPLQSVGIALSQVAQSSAQRVLRMGDPAFTRLPRFLSPNDTTLAYTTIQKPVSLLATEIRALSHPVSSDALAVAGNIEDVATNGPLAAQRLGQQAVRLRTLLGIELIHAAQAVDLRTRADGQRPVGKGTGAVLAAFRQEVPFLSQDRRLADDIARAERFLDEERAVTP
ncbi:Histidine ammonia-lyase [Achromobacter sp. 2789STDY5608633]|jgi:histidine ammonia-lyase|uniref:Histidine ammonia-lyase n=1 Tax=Achromobacter insuavis TaxID=1287735 RepID=A0A6J4ZSM3_9BURK|nr:Histidine ammonia-lyase [Achromobacter insuavis]CUI65041.1 Histidine ammonia-lyase [Achromobacter sp. 2789STDY5608633]CUJ09037.1 Histidine ammonia-lyase [Achromobacter sp. 2789STDY5608628]CUJ32338.1 Histidine ammonia-lyase [Achromobacter sp. 2789STDY5608621]